MFLTTYSAGELPVSCLLIMVLSAAICYLGNKYFPRTKINGSITIVLSTALLALFMTGPDDGVIKVALFMVGALVFSCMMYIGIGVNINSSENSSTK